jgi:hypothetical protein
MNGRALKTTSEVIDALGGTKAVQALTRAKSRQAVWNWRRFRTFPANHFDCMTEALAQLKPPLTAPASLWGQTAARLAAWRKVLKNGSCEGARASM